ncbi:protein mono-ADP-ribosyltransferase PARP14-like isoform X2 [Gouania willdenowi]|uniref:Poly [ADP-ribose] polymerase n=1 Tax=Gouania willdenowi TaxID=441366 RepID=A0A8C5HYC1_GOUWI|nr:protein mono-ADP-ribosyltransferase PARP14-like isoform X2 [Gouania willdenowi]
MAEDQHSLFFKAKDLTGSDKEQIRKHFQVPLEKVKDDYYKISFNKQEEQERVLQKKFHTVPRSKGELTITVSRTLTSGVPSTTKPKVDVLVAPILDTKLTSTRIGSHLLDKAGNGLKEKFDSLASKGYIGPGQVLQVDLPPNLTCSKIIFIRCLPWDGKNSGKSFKALKHGLQQCLNLCEEEQWNSVSFPIIGPGIVLKYPLEDAVKALTDTIGQFKSFGSLTDINIIVKPGHPDSAESYNLVQEHLRSLLNKGRKGSFGSLATDLDPTSMTLEGDVELELVFGDITNEKTDAVVNSTDFKTFDFEGVCKHILAKAGPEVKAELQQATVQRGEIFKSGPGNFPCKAILHVCAFKNADLVEKLSTDIICHCEIFQYKSVAIPSICAGVGGLAPDVVAKAILRGIRTVTSSRNLKVVKNIRIVLYTINSFLAFKKEAEQIFSCDVTKAPPVNKRLSFPPCEDQQSKFLVLGLSREKVNNAQINLKDLYQAQCSTQSFTAEELNSLTWDDEKSFKDLIPSHGLCMKYDSSGSLIVSGLKDGVNQAVRIIQNSRQNQLELEIIERNKQEMYERVAWCIMGNDGQWVRLPPTANYRLEKPDKEKTIVDADGNTWIPNLQRMTATKLLSGNKQTLKRLRIEPDFTYPLYWDNMEIGESQKMVPLSPSTAEHQTVKAAFQQTQTSTIIKIERLQNIPLRRAYEVQKKNLSNKSGDNEKLLFHGTNPENINSIITNGFDRRYSGQNATSYGLGTYFAINANYSANPKYSKPAADGSQSMFMARVLTGIYVLGHIDMKVLPPRDPHRSPDRYDSAVDNLDNPQMFVVFQDNQAYPDYLITFK